MRKSIFRTDFSSPRLPWEYDKSPRTAKVGTSTARLAEAYLSAGGRLTMAQVAQAHGVTTARVSDAVRAVRRRRHAQLRSSLTALLVLERHHPGVLARFLDQGGAS